MHSVRFTVAGRKTAWLTAGVPIAAALALSAVTPVQAGSDRVNTSGNVLIADQFNNRVVEVDAHHHIVWHFGDGSSVAGPNSIVGPNDAERVGDGLTLIAGTGTPAGADPSCTDPNGCADNRVILVDRSGHIEWQYGTAGIAGTADNQLNTPVQATMLENGHVLITDQANERVIEVNRAHHVVWQYGTTGLVGNGPNQLSNPNSAERLSNGHILIADENNNRVIEVNHHGDIVWQIAQLSDGTSLNGAAFASRLPNGHTLITDSLNNRIVEVTRAGQVVWSYDTTARAGSMAQPNPTRAVRLRDGDTLISDQFNDQVISVDRNGAIEFAQGQIQVDGTGFDQLNAPYDAKVIGDFTGLTPPGKGE